MPTSNTELQPNADYVDLGAADGAAVYITTASDSMEIVFSTTKPDINFRGIKVSASAPLTSTLSGTDNIWAKPYSKDDLVTAIVVT